MNLRDDFPAVTPSFIPLQPGTDIPDWNSEAFLSGYERLMAALGAKYANDPRLGYVDVGGYAPGGFKEMAGGVDSVLRAQFERYKRYAETGKP